MSEQSPIDQINVPWRPTLSANIGESMKRKTYQQYVALVSKKTNLPITTVQKALDKFSEIFYAEDKKGIINGSGLLIWTRGYQIKRARAAKLSKSKKKK